MYKNFDVNLREPSISKTKRGGGLQIHQLQHTDQNLMTRPIFKVHLRLCTLRFTESKLLATKDKSGDAYEVI